MAIPDDIKTVEQILGWVGKDAARATEALAAEKADSAPRKSLVEKLEALAGAQADAPTTDPTPTDGEPGESPEPDEAQGPDLGTDVWVRASSGRHFEVQFGSDTYLRLIKEGGHIVDGPEAED